MLTTIYEPGTLRIVAVCDGPDDLGSCPQASAEERVPCAGYEIEVWAEGDVKVADRRVRVPRLSRLCPLDPRGAFRAVYTAGEGYFHPFAPQGD